MKVLFVVVAVLSWISGFGAGFDCNKASSNIEKMICDDRELLQKDTQLNHIYKLLIPLNLDNSFKESQRQWIKKRNNCKTFDCLHEFYNNRFEEFDHRVKYQFASKQVNSICSEVSTIFNANLGLIRKGYFEDSNKNIDNFEFIKSNKNLTSHSITYKLDINNDGKKEFVIGKVFPYMLENWGIDYYSSEEEYQANQQIKLGTISYSPKIYLLKKIDLINTLSEDQKLMYTHAPYELQGLNGIFSPHMHLFRFKKDIYVLTGGGLSEDNNWEYLDDIIKEGEVFLISKFNDKNELNDLCVMYKKLYLSLCSF